MQAVHPLASRTVTGRTDAVLVLDLEKDEPTWMQKETEQCNGDDERSRCSTSTKARHRRSSRKAMENGGAGLHRLEGEEDEEEEEEGGRRNLKER